MSHFERDDETRLQQGHLSAPMNLLQSLDTTALNSVLHMKNLTIRKT